MIDIAATLPRRHGFAPTSAETFNTREEQRAHRFMLFNQIDSDRNGTISFEEWITFSLAHIREKVTWITDAMKAPATYETNKQDYAAWVIAACRSRASIE